jgi:2-keto-3-deoxy-L-fuconate dehydrogenase
MTQLTGLRAIVTGGTVGMSLATAHLLVSHGAQVAGLDLDPRACPRRWWHPR